MKFQLNPNPRGMSNDELIEEVRKVDTLLNKVFLTMGDFHKVAKIHPSTLQKRFGSWKNVLAAAGLKHKFAGLPENIKIRRSQEKISDEKIISELKRIAQTLKKESVTMEEFEANSKLVINPETVRRRFGSWVVLTEKAGLKLSSKYRRRYSNEEYFENLLNVWTYHGRQPFYREIEEYPSTITAGAYEGRFGSWRKALEAFVNKMDNNEEPETTKNIESKETTKKIKNEIPQEKKNLKPIGKTENRRGITLSLRYKVLVRDNFKCVRCGRNPATNPGVELHVDHIIPFSRGGKTLLENLETKCKECNLGKGDKFNEKFLTRQSSGQSSPLP